MGGVAWYAPPMSTTFSADYQHLKTRWESHTDASGDGCWHWLLKPDPQGYGQMNIGQKRIMRAHRLSYLINVGDIPDDMVVMHKCDNRICVRPDHLTLGSRADNLADCRAKGRWHNHPKPRRDRIGRKGPEPKPIAGRLDALVRKGSDDDCWPYMGTCDPNGYGRFFVAGTGRNGYKPFAHRVAYELAYGPVPDGLVVMHICDNPTCCNPSHLRIGTRADNNRDRSEKGRGRENRQWGSANPRAKLTAEMVLQIRKMVRDGLSQGKVAKLFGIKQPQVSRLVRGVSWPDGPWP